jgi:hypothetical protein
MTIILSDRPLHDITRFQRSCTIGISEPPITMSYDGSNKSPEFSAGWAHYEPLTA